MQARDRGNEAQAQARAGLRAAFLQAHEALQRALAVFRRDAGSAIGHGDLDGVADARAGDDLDRLRRRIRCPAAEYLMALSTRLAIAWLTSSRLATRLRPGGAETARPQTGLLGHRLVELGDVADDGGRIDRCHALGDGAAFQPRDQQQRVEGA